MAPRNRPADTKPVSPLAKTDTPTDYRALLKPSTGLPKASRGRETGPNPCAGFVALALSDGPQCLPVANTEQAKKVTNDLRRDVPRDDENNQAASLSVRYNDGKGNWLDVDRSKDAEGKTVTTWPEGIREVHFAAKAEARKRSYTAADIRVWAKANGHGEITGKVPSHVRKAFKAARAANATDPASA